MREFADLVRDGIIKEPDDFYICRKFSIEELLNTKITILNVIKNLKTSHGDGRYLVHFKNDTLGEGKFFTNSRTLKDQLSQIPDAEYPVSATLIQIRDGNKKTYKLT